MNKPQKIYSHVIPEMEDWPIYKLHQQRKTFVQEIDDFTFNRLKNSAKEKISDLIAKTIYLERIRIKEEPWKVDPPNERQFWRRIQKKLVRTSMDRDEEEARAVNEELLQQIIHRYSEEIVGTFRIKTFIFSRKFLTVFFNRLLNTAAGKKLHRIWGTKHQLYNKLLIHGDVEKTRSLMTKGTIVIVPTHFSNLDSILIGYALDAIVGLPSFSYGAGLNLYNTGYTAYFMNRLGAYRVDRRKKNAIYLETLKAMSNLSIQRGTNTLFFPGGTRSRAGMLENKLKLGLLGTAVEAQRALYQRGEDSKIYIIPLILGYHFVLEAKFLIDQYLEHTGKEQYLKTRDQGNSIRKMFKFVWALFARENTIHLSFGKPMDVLGNFVDENGVSYDQSGRPVDVKEYFMSNGKIQTDLQREAEYTKILADKIVERYYKDNLVLTSHLVAFAAFNILRHENDDLDLYGLLRLPTDEYYFRKETLLNVIEQLQQHLFAMEARGEIKLSDEIQENAEKVLVDGIKRLGNYHVNKPLIFDKKKRIISQSFSLLFYYHNRLQNYGLHKAIQWQKMPEPQALVEIED